MNEPHVLFERQWVVGGFEVHPDVANTENWRAWRDIHICILLEEQVRSAIEECFALTMPLTGDTSTQASSNTRVFLEEAAINLLGHGKKGVPTRPSEILFRALELNAQDPSYLFQLRMQDDLPRWDIDNLPDPTLDENLEKETGRGIHLIRWACRVKIHQVELPPDIGGKHMEYEWRSPKYTLREVGFDEDEPSAEPS